MGESLAALGEDDGQLNGICSRLHEDDALLHEVTPGELVELAAIEMRCSCLTVLPIGEQRMFVMFETPEVATKSDNDGRAIRNI